MVFHRPTFAEVNLSALRHNMDQIVARLPQGQKILPIIKANAYGHGAPRLAEVLGDYPVTGFGVATVEEALELREHGMDQAIFVLGGLLTSQIQVFIQNKLTPVIPHISQLNWLALALEDIGKNLEVHLKFDTGMGRLGFFVSQLEEIKSLLAKHPAIRVSGILTHLARADEEDQGPTQKQVELFGQIEQQLQTPVYHLANSAAIIDGTLDHTNWVRPGIMLYGAYPHPRHQEKIDLKPVLSLKTHILSLKQFPQNSPISYGGTFVTQRESSIAVLPIGYADGYPRLVSNRGCVLVGGVRAPIVGRICMDLMMVDVTDVKGVAVGDEAVLIGSQAEQMIRAEEVAGWAETISYEIFCGLTSRVPRVYKE